MEENLSSNDTDGVDSSGHAWLLGSPDKEEKSFKAIDPALEGDHEDFTPLVERSDRNSRLSFSSAVSSGSATLHPNNSANMSLFLLLNNMIGSGILNQPYVFMKSGFIGAAIAYVVAIPAVYSGLMLMTAAGIELHCLEYSGLAKIAFPAYGENIVDLSIVAMTFGCQCGYLIIVGSSLSRMLGEWGCESDFCGQYIVTVISVLVFVVPPCMLRHFGHLGGLSIFSMASIVLCILLVVIMGPIKRGEGHHGGDPYEFFNPLGFVQSFGSIVLSLSCASANFQAFISTERKSRNLESWSYVAGGTTLIGSMMCIVMGVFGYYSFNGDTDGMILDNFSAHVYDFFKLMVVAHLLFYIPINFIIMRYSICKLLFSVRSEHMTTASHVVMTLILLVVTTAIVMALWAAGLTSGVAFSLIMNLTGGIAGSLSTLILPAAMYLKLMPKESSMYGRAQFILLFGALVFCCVVPVSIFNVL